MLSLQTGLSKQTYIYIYMIEKGQNYPTSDLSRGSSTLTCARPVEVSPSFRARCAMAARCPCSATASRTPSKPSSALPAMRTACSPVWAAPSEDVKCLALPPSPSLDQWEPQHSSTRLPWPLLGIKWIFNKIKHLGICFCVVAVLLSQGVFSTESTFVRCKLILRFCFFFQL